LQGEHERLAQCETLYIAAWQKHQKTLDNLLAVGANVPDITAVRVRKAV
jgi:hypothetical protein